MKNLVIIVSLLMVSGSYAQEKVPVDKMETTKTTTTTVQKNGEKAVVSKVKETTRKEQEIKTKQQKGNTVNGYKVDTPIKVTKTIEIDSNWDPFNEASDQMHSYMFDGQKMTFISNPYGFLIAAPDTSAYGEARRLKNNHLYLTNTNGQAGVGYFDSNGTFIVEYYDKEKDVMVTEIYEVNQ